MFFTLKLGVKKRAGKTKLSKKQIFLSEKCLFVVKLVVVNVFYA